MSGLSAEKVVINSRRCRDFFMEDGTRKKRIFISACEPSGDLHCANLIKALKKASGGDGSGDCEIEFVGLGGIERRDVRATVLPNMADDEVLLGMSFLKHLELVQSGDRLVIRARPY